MADTKLKSDLSRSHMLLFVLVALIMELCSHLAMAGTHVKYLPGFHGRLPFELETGYIGVRQSEVQLFYYFIKSESNPETDPVILWLIGGPGCSALYGIANEIGPLRFDGIEYNGSLPTLSYNPYGYTKVANIIFLDLPVETGFSYAKSQNARYTDDQLASEDAYQFLLKWLIENPKYQSNPLYVGGQSYGGFFGPIVTQLISDGIEAGTVPQVNLKGYICESPMTFIPGLTNYKIIFAHGMSLISDELYESLDIHCGGEYENIDPKNSLCAQDLHTFNKLLTGIYETHILEPVCDSISTKVPTISSQRRSLDEKFEKLKSPIALPGMKCREDWYGLSNFWANDKDVQKALHVRKGTIGVWKFWNKKVLFTCSIYDSVPYHAYLSTKNYRSLIYSGDHDMSVPFQSTQTWIRSLNYSVIEDWRPWTFQGQIAGYTTTYSNRMTYATVKGAGHGAPEWTPAQCLAMLKRWLSHESL